MLFASCKQSCFEVITHNDVGYWSDGWTPKDPTGSIREFSKKDSTLKYLGETWAYETWSPALWGLKFRITNDTLFTYVNRKGKVMVYDTLSVVSYSKNTFNALTNNSYHVKLHRISTKYARKMMSSQVKLSFLLNKRDYDRKIADITGVVWKLYGYGDVSTGIVKKSESLKNEWMSVIKFQGNGIMIGQSASNDICGKYAISGSNIEFLSFDKNGEVEGYDGKDFCEALQKCTMFKLKNNWLQLFYNDGKNFLVFKVSKNVK